MSLQDESKPDELRGLYHKFNVYRVRDGKQAEPVYNCFVLRIRRDPFAIPALRAYADACKEQYPSLAQDIHAWLDMESESEANG